MVECAAATLEQVIAIITGIAGLLTAGKVYLDKMKLEDFFVKGVKSTSTTDAAPIVEVPAITKKVPGDSWRMKDTVKQWITFNESPEDRRLILDQIEKAEAQGLTHYRILYGRGKYYDIEYGLLAGAGGGG